MKQTEPDITPAEQWALLRWKAGHMVPFVQDTTADGPRTSCRTAWGRVLLHTACGVLLARVLGRR